MSKKFVIFSLALFALIINIALALFFTLPVDSSEQVNHRMKASINSSIDTDSSNTQILENSEENLIASEQSEKNENDLSSIPTQDMSLGTEMPPVAPLGEADKQEEIIIPVENNENTLEADSSEEIEAEEKNIVSQLKSVGSAKLEVPPLPQVIIDAQNKTNNEEVIEEEKEVLQEDTSVEIEAAVPPVEPAVKIELPPTEPEQEPEPKAVRKIVDEITIGYANNILTLRVKGNQKMKGKTLYVGNPERALLDIEGKWILPALPKFPPNPYSTDIRTGYQEDATRFVVDIKTKRFTRRLVQIDSNTVELRVTFQ